MLILVIVLLALWLIMVVLGFAIKSLFALVFIGIILFVATAIIGIVRRRKSGSRNSGV